MKISEKLTEVVATARNMCNALTHCLDLLAQQEEVRLDSGCALHVCCVNCTIKYLITDLNDHFTKLVRFRTCLKLIDQLFLTFYFTNKET